MTLPVEKLLSLDFNSEMPHKIARTMDEGKVAAVVKPVEAGFTGLCRARGGYNGNS